uniref:7TM_GPCR_Srx domain-containing protein n=1 Tax=Panagrellus redivivus TaxID=6233 RepID=A0A7E4V9F3_PANRE
MMEEVPATFVLISPYVFQNSKKVEFVAKHGALFFAVIFFLYMTLSHLNEQSYVCVLFLPQVVFYSLTYIIGCTSDNKMFQQIQILITSILILYSYGLTSFVNSTSLVLLLTLAYVLMSIYSFVLFVALRKHYVKDLSTPQSVSRLNIVDLCNLLLVSICIVSAIVFTEIGNIWFLLDTEPTRNIQNVSVALWGLVGSFICLIILLVDFYNDVTRCNHSKSMPKLRYVEFDCNGRAWFAVSSQFLIEFRRLPGVAAFHCLLLIDGISQAAQVDIDQVLNQRMLKNFL